MAINWFPGHMVAAQKKAAEALALLNPHQPGCAFPFKGLASVGVAVTSAAGGHKAG